jgi:hypothetical protein
MGLTYAAENGQRTVTVDRAAAAAKGCKHWNSKYGTPAQCGDCPAARTGTPAADGHAPSSEPAAITIPYGTRPLDEARDFAAKILWAPDYMLDALAAAIAASHVLEAWNAVPRILATSPLGETGKTTLFNVIRLLAQNTWTATQATSFALKSKFNDRGAPFILADEVSDFFGLDGRRGQANPIGTVARDCYLRNATASVSRNGTTEDIPAFCFMALAGRRNAVPVDIYTRCIEFKMRPVPESVPLELDALDPDTEAMAVDVRTMLHAYMRAMLAPEIKRIQRQFKPPHPKFRVRLRQIWMPLYATALAADNVERQRYEAECLRRMETGEPPPDPPVCNWAQRILTAFKAMALDASDLPVLTSAQSMLRDTAAYIRSQQPAPEFACAADIRDWLRDNTDNQLWATLTDRRLAILMTEGLGPNTVRARPDDPTHKARGWYAADILARWDALDAALTPPVSREPEQDESSLFDDIEATEDETATEDDPGSPAQTRATVATDPDDTIEFARVSP